MHAADTQFEAKNNESAHAPRPRSLFSTTTATLRQTMLTNFALITTITRPKWISDGDTFGKLKGRGFPKRSPEHPLPAFVRG